MWILPKTLKSSSLSEIETRTLCLENVFIRGEYATPRIWLNIQNTKAWSCFIFEHTQTQYTPPHMESALGTFKQEKSVCLQKTSNIWCDLPLFNISNENLTFCEFSEAAWDDWELKQYSHFRMRITQGDSQQKKWATPCVRDHFDAKITAPLPQRKDGKSRMDGIARQALDVEQYRGPLNPRWIEPLMGLQVGWVTPTFGKRKK
jgi:hypothetical protein